MAATCNSCTCTKTSFEGGGRLKQCAQCLTAVYCSRKCQIADWNAHKPVCLVQLALNRPKSGNHVQPRETPKAATKGLEKASVKPFTRLDNGTWLHDRPEKDVYRLLIDAYRIHAADKLSYEEDAALYSLLAGELVNLWDFRLFLVRVEVAGDGTLLPLW